MSIKSQTILFWDEVVSGITHGAGAVLSLIGASVLVTLAVLTGSVWHIVGCVVYAVTLVLLYSSSTMLHSFPWPKVKRVFQVIDHSVIFAFIAGTYTPFLLVSVQGYLGWGLLVFLWCIALFAILDKILKAAIWKKVSNMPLLYLLMGWVAIFAIKPMYASLSPIGMLLVFLGGLFYSFGVIFFKWEKLPFNHTIWHSFVLVGSILHYFSIVFFVLPVRV
ncbi:MAG: hemolysin III family protein [bacterium]